MEMNRLTRDADDLIRKVVARYNSLYTPAGNISQVDLDLLLDDLRLLYDKFKLVSQLNLQHQYQESKKATPVVQPAENKETPPPPATRQEPEHYPVAEEKIPQEPEPVQPTEAEVTPVHKEAPATEPEQEVHPEPPVPEAGPEPEPVKHVEETPYTAPVRETAAATLADRFRTEQKSLSDIISSGSEESIGSKLSHTPIPDLKSVIGLAEKFAFVNELFNGDQLAYEKAIVQLNGATRLTEAEAYLNTLRLNHKWPADSPQAGLLTDIIRRKFNSR